MYLPRVPIQLTAHDTNSIINFINNDIRKFSSEISKY